MLTLDDTTTIYAQDNDDDRIVILDGQQRRAYFSNNTINKKPCGLFNKSFTKRLKACVSNRFTR